LTSELTSELASDTSMVGSDRQQCEGGGRVDHRSVGVLVVFKVVTVHDIALDNPSGLIPHFTVWFKI
jgi:hypothetical protein